MREDVKKQHPNFTSGEIAKELGRRWGVSDDNTKARYDAKVEQDKARYRKVRLIVDTFGKMQKFMIFSFWYFHEMNACKKTKIQTSHKENLIDEDEEEDDEDEEEDDEDEEEDDE